MAKLLKLRRGTTTQHGSFTGAEGEVTIDTTKDTAVVHDGSQTGGRPLAREDLSNVSANTVRNLVENASDSNTFTDSDHSKLNGIAANATNVTNNNQLTNGAGYTNDQTKSEIDALNINADQVDGLEASQFLRSDAADTATGDITFNGGTGAITLSGNSDIRSSYGNWTGEAAKIQWHSNHLYFCTSQYFYFRDSDTGNTLVSIDASGNLTAVGNVTAYSDVRLKTDISTINDALGICGKLRGVSYKWIKDSKPSIGVIAQEVEQVIPEVVLTNTETNPSTGETTEVKSVDYGKIVGVLINAINELKAEVDELKGGK